MAAAVKSDGPSGACIYCVCVWLCLRNAMTPRQDAVSTIHHSIFAYIHKTFAFQDHATQADSWKINRQIEQEIFTACFSICLFIFNISIQASPDWSLSTYLAARLYILHDLQASMHSRVQCRTGSRRSDRSTKERLLWCCVCVRRLHMCMCACLCVCLSQHLRAESPMRPGNAFACMCAGLCMRIQIYICVYIYGYTCTDIDTCI